MKIIKDGSVQVNVTMSETHFIFLLGILNQVSRWNIVHCFFQNFDAR